MFIYCCQKQREEIEDLEGQTKENTNTLTKDDILCHVPNEEVKIHANDSNSQVTLHFKIKH